MNISTTGYKIDEGVAIQLAAVTLDSRGRPRNNNHIGYAIRGALLIDLTYAGSIVRRDDRVELDASPTGFIPADRLMAAMVHRPGKSLSHWILHGRVSLGDLTNELVRTWVWKRRRPPALRRRYTCTEPRWATDDSEVGAVAATLARKVLLFSGPIVGKPTGEAAWITESVLSLLTSTLSSASKPVGLSDALSVAFQLPT